MQSLEGAAGKAGAAHEGLDEQGTLRDIWRVLEETYVASHKGRCEEAEDLPEGEVPGHDGEDDAEWIPPDITGVLSGDGFRSEDARSVSGVVAAA